MHIYFDKRDTGIIKLIKAEAKTRRRSAAYIVKEKLRKAYGVNGQGGD